VRWDDCPWVQSGMIRTICGRSVRELLKGVSEVMVKGLNMATKWDLVIGDGS